ncbi:MAG: ABC transporter substrate-binding protein [Solirubrobacteraceae bacterium]|jgi:peptide/nickel transport system substrate-binding protein
MRSDDALTVPQDAGTGFGRRRKVRARSLAALLITAVAALALTACGGSSPTMSSKGIYGSLPPAGTPVKGGTITQGQLTGQTPTYIFPIAPGANTSTGTISLLSELFMPLYAGPTGNVPEVDENLSAANTPIFSDGDKTVTIPIKPGLHWANGAPVVANDVVFWFDLLKAAVKESPANWGQYSPGLMPDNVASITTSGKYNVVMHLTGPYNPGFFLNNNLSDTNNVYPLPSTDWNVDAAGGPHLTDWSNPAVAKKIYDYLNKQGSSVATFATNPLWKDGDGPFKLTSFSATNSSYTLVPNPGYGGTPKPIMSEVSVQTYTGFTAELDAVKAGGLDIMVGFDPSQLAERKALAAQGIDVFGGPGWGWFAGIINFKDKTNDFNNVIAQTYVRQAIDYLIDEPNIIKAVYKGAAVPAYTEVPTYPTSPYAPASAGTAPFPYSAAKAVALLKSHGWNVVPGGTTTCAKPGTGSGECGAGIPAGTPISFVWANQPEAVATTGALEAEVVESDAKQAGIDITLQTKAFNFLTANYNDQNPAAVTYTNDWGVNNYGGLFTDYYPTGEGVWNVGGGFNLGDFNDPKANALMNASVHSGSPSAVKAEAAYLETHPPVFFMPDGDYLLAVNTNKVAGPADGWTSMTQQQWFPQYWYVK